MDQLNLKKATAETVYTSTSANRNENNISCHEGLILYSRTNCPILYDLDNLQVVAELIGHKDEVNGQCFISDTNQLEKISGDEQRRIHIISTSHDKTAIIWEVTISTENNQPKLINQKILFHIKSPKDDVFTTRCSSRLQENEFLTVTTTMEGDVYLWLNDQLVQTITAKNCCFDSNFFSIKVDDLTFKFLFLAGGDNKVHIYQVDLELKLVHLLDLTGYNDWVKCLDIIKLPGREDEFLLASACQDCYIRIWAMKLIGHELDKSLVRTIASPPFKSDPNKSSVYRLTATLETILSGHEGIVHSLSWFRRQKEPLLQLISCSEDKTIVIWRSKVAPRANDHQANGTNAVKKYESCPASAEVWKEVQRVGETGETNLPFLGVCLSSDEKNFYAQSLRGAIHSWGLVDDDRWEPRTSITGHYGPITDLAWQKSGSYLLSSSLDKTCRMHAVARADNKWHELTRPQVHGHEINCLASIDFHTFASGAEEKTIRTFGATKFFLRNFETLAKAKLPTEAPKSCDDMPVHAQLPALGLSNKGASSPYDVGGGGGAATTTDENAQDKRDSANNDWNEISNLVKQLAQLDHLKTLPFEEILLQSTLWWESSKLFGHCNELYSLASNSAGSFLASASKANRADLATIFVWDTGKFRRVASIEHHSLTITRLKFSPDDKYLLSVSRDRTWCLSERSAQQQQMRNAYKKFIGTSKTSSLHERIIWDCCWTHDSKYFMTVSRDKKANLWSMERLRRLSSSSSGQGAAESQDESGDKPSRATSVESSCVSSLLFDCSIQAVDSPLFSPFSGTQAYLFALGLEDGSLRLGYVQIEAGQSTEVGPWHLLATFDSFHQLSIKRLAFRPAQDEESDLLLASGGDDCVVKLTRFSIK